jgi:polyhydroxyalkanoate synthesis regulator phasin
MTLNELIDQLKEAEDLEAVQLLQQQAKEIEQLNFVLKNLTLATNKKINELEEEIENLKNKVQYWKGLHR